MPAFGMAEVDPAGDECTKSGGLCKLDLAPNYTSVFSVVAECLIHSKSLIFNSSNL